MASFTYFTFLIVIVGNVSAKNLSENQTIPETRQSSCSCGVSPIPTTNRVINGSPAVSAEFPWRCSLHIDDKNYFMCTCTVISASMVMTAAHCLSGLSTTSRLFVKVGAIDKGATTEAGTSVWMSTKGYVKYPLYDGKQKHDIALVYLATRLTFSISIQPACLPFSLRATNLEGSVGTISGWGLTQWGGSASEKLMKAEMPVLVEDVCRKTYGSYWPENNLCVGGQGKSACKGDSGGGLDIVMNGRSYTVGVAQSVAPQCITNVPNIYTKVANYLDWISGISRLVHGEELCQL